MKDLLQQAQSKLPNVLQRLQVAEERRLNVIKDCFSKLEKVKVWSDFKPINSALIQPTIESQRVANGDQTATQAAGLPQSLSSLLSKQSNEFNMKNSSSLLQAFARGLMDDIPTSNSTQRWIHYFSTLAPV